MLKNNLLYSNDQTGRYPPSWYATSCSELDHQPALAESVSCDVCIIGAGFTGLSAALTLVASGVDVVLLDAHRIGWGASGRNGGQLGSGQRLEQDELEERYGLDQARALWDLAEASKQHVKDLIDEHNIDCDYRPGIVHVNHKRGFTRKTEAYVAKLNREYQYDQITFADQSEVRERLASVAYYSGSVDIGSGHLHPLKLAFGYAGAAVKQNVRIYENTEVLKYTETARKVTVKTKRGDVSASRLLLACNGYLGDLNRQVASSVMPINNYIIATEPLDTDLAESLIRENMAVADSKFVVNYFRISNDNRLLFGGRESYGYRFPEDIKFFVRSAMLDVYPQLENVTVDYGWGGTLAITMNRMPYIKQLSANVISSSGYSGHGVGMATMAGKLCAEAMVGKLDSFNVMSAVDHMAFPGGTFLRSPLLKLGMFYYSLRDKL